MKNFIVTLSMMLACSPILAENIDITGTVESRCIINTDTAGYYGNPSAHTLSTTPADGGAKPVIRIDNSLAGSYWLQVSYPTSFSSSPSLSDTVAWTGSATVAQTSSSDMSNYQSTSTTVGNMRQYGLSVAGTVWIEVASSATYGGGQNKPFPAGNYKAYVLAECIAQ